jgi:putative N6-adenine-specific DNA methylase
MTPEMEPSDTLPLFAVTAPGLEALCAAELRAMGIDAAPEPGGVAWEGTRAQLYAANLRLRTASRLLLRVAEFRARTFFELERHARRLPWERFVRPGRAVRLRVTARKSKLYHEGAIAERLLEALERKVGGVGSTAAARGEEAEEEGAEEQLFVVRFHYDRCTLSADASGALLAYRGYRQAVAKAPLRETLAAAVLLGSGWDGRSPLLDPMCGSGTLAIEGALLARRIAPGLSHPDGVRRYAFQEWPDFDGRLWEQTVERARGEALPAAGVPLHASDRDAGAVEAARANAERAGVLSDLALEVRPLSGVEPPPGAGWLVSNPPYGVRVGESTPLRNLYAALGRFARERLPGWRVALLSADRTLEGHTGLRFTEALRTRNGGIPVRLVVARVEG